MYPYFPTIQEGYSANIHVLVYTIENPSSEAVWYESTITLAFTIPSYIYYSLISVSG